MLTDSFGRKLDYLRISVTDRCNLRCLYCMPPEGVQWKPHGDILSFEEIIVIVKIMAGLGVRKIKVTGGEPLLRRGTPSFLKNLKAVEGIERVTITTNGLLLGAYLEEAASLGADALPDGVNLSIDALDAQRYMHITHRQGVEPKTILPLIDVLLEKDIPVKINCVPVRSFNEEEILPLAELAMKKNIAVRFIELMPIGTASAFGYIPAEEVASQIEKAYGKLTPYCGVPGSGPAVYYSLPNFSGKIGFISPVTCGFCEKCNRLRLTSEGFLKLCLSSDLGLDLRGLLRAGSCSNDLARAIIEIAAKKPRFHTFSETYGLKKNHPGGMSEIGG